MPIRAHQNADVSVLGLGPMGRALTRAFLAADLRTTVWNRTPGKDDELIDRGAVRARSVEAAVTASPLTVVCVVNGDAVDAVVRQSAATEALASRTLVNLTADTPERARSTAAWAAEKGIRYLDGAIMTPTPTIGTPAAAVIYSGPEELHQENRPVLDALGGNQSYLGSDVGRAAAYEIALLDIFWTAMAGYAHSMAVARAEGITAADLAPFAKGIGTILPSIFEQVAIDVDERKFSAEGSPLTSAVSSMTHIVETSEAHGIESGMMRAAEGLARRAIGLGHGADGFLRVVELLNPSE